MSREGPPPKAGAGGAPRPRGRPTRLTDEIQEQIVAYVRAGAFQGAAAQAAGIPERTFYEWMARGRGEHPTRRPTARLRAFAQAVDQAHAQARVGAEVRVYREHPKYWLAHAARSRPDSDGWTHLKEHRETEARSGDTLEERFRQLRDLGIYPPD